MKYFVNNSTHWCSLTLKYVLQHVSVHEFSRNQKIVTDGFPWSLGTEPKKLLSMGFEILGLVSCTTQLVDYSPVFPRTTVSTSQSRNCLCFDRTIKLKSHSWKGIRFPITKKYVSVRSPSDVDKNKNYSSLSTGKTDYWEAGGKRISKMLKGYQKH